MSKYAIYAEKTISAFAQPILIMQDVLLLPLEYCAETSQR